MLQLKSLTLACGRFAVAHTGDAIGRKLASIFQEFQIQSKMVNVVRDNTCEKSWKLVEISLTTLF